MAWQPSKGNGPLKSLSDNPEQVQESMERLGSLRDQLCEIFQAAIARVHNGQQESDRRFIDEIGERDAKDKTLLE